MADQALDALSEKLAHGQDLTTPEIGEVALLLASSGVSDGAKCRFLKCFSAKGETPAEVAALASAYRAEALPAGLEDWAGRAIDIVGTGGDGIGTFNISTTTAFIVAAAGVPVIKHGNRSITSKSGSADLLGAVGIPLETDEATRRRSMEQLNFCFLFAPAFHPAFKHIAPVRKQLAAEGVRTVFNSLGPLINPACPAYEVMGVFASRWLEPLAGALHALGLKRGWVINGRLPDGRELDEITCVGTNQLAGFGEWQHQSQQVTAADVGLADCSLEAILGGDAADNFTRLKAVARGEAPIGLIHTLQWNAGLALWTAGDVATLAEGIQKAGTVIQQGHLASWLKRAETFYQQS